MPNFTAEQVKMKFHIRVFFIFSTAIVVGFFSQDRIMISNQQINHLKI
jgi:hypothetical protein